MYTFSNCLYTDVKINLGLFLGHSRIFIGFQQLIFHYITFSGFQQLIFHYITRLYIYIANPCHLPIKTFCIAIIFLFFYFNSIQFFMDRCIMVFVPFFMLESCCTVFEFANYGSFCLIILET